MKSLARNNCEIATILFPNGLKRKRGILIGLNISEFMVVVVDVVPHTLDEAQMIVNQLELDEAVVKITSVLHPILLY